LDARQSSIYNWQYNLAKLLSLMLHAAAVKEKTNMIETSSAHENAKLSTIACPYQNIYPPDYRYLIVQRYPKQSSTDVQGKTLIKM
jgi:hypothetical protein